MATLDFIEEQNLEILRHAEVPISKWFTVVLHVYYDLRIESTTAIHFKTNYCIYIEEQNLAGLRDTEACHVSYIHPYIFPHYILTFFRMYLSSCYILFTLQMSQSRMSGGDIHSNLGSLRYLPFIDSRPTCPTQFPVLEYYTWVTSVEYPRITTG